VHAWRTTTRISHRLHDPQDQGSRSQGHVISLSRLGPGCTCVIRGRRGHTVSAERGGHTCCSRMLYYGKDGCLFLAVQSSRSHHVTSSSQSRFAATASSSSQVSFTLSLSLSLSLSLTLPLSHYPLYLKNVTAQLSKMQKSHFLITLIICASCLFKLLLDKSDSKCHNIAEVITFTYFLAYCFVFVMKVKVNNNNQFFSHPPNLLF